MDNHNLTQLNCYSYVSIQTIVQILSMYTFSLTIDIGFLTLAIKVSTNVQHISLSITLIQSNKHHIKLQFSNLKIPEKLSRNISGETFYLPIPIDIKVLVSLSFIDSSQAWPRRVKQKSPSHRKNWHTHRVLAYSAEPSLAEKFQGFLRIFRGNFGNFSEFSGEFSLHLTKFSFNLVKLRQKQGFFGLSH